MCACVGVWAVCGDRFVETAYTHPPATSCYVMLRHATSCPLHWSVVWMYVCVFHFIDHGVGHVEDHLERSSELCACSHVNSTAGSHR